MPKPQETAAEQTPADPQSDQSRLSQRLDELVTRFAARNLQAQLDFDDFVADGLGEKRGNVLSHMGNFSLLDRGRK
ncbi:MAG: hypothetical protein V4709_11785 [Pseudomonadota bacterium]|jgi:hypothetical protein